MMCFPELYPYGVGGQACQREVHLPPAEYVKCILMSRDSRKIKTAVYILFAAPSHHKTDSKWDIP